MAYDTGLEARIDESIQRASLQNLTKKKMFGGVGYLLSGNMTFGIWQDHLIVRCGLEHYEEYLDMDNVREFDITGRSMTGWIMVAPEGMEADTDLEKWMTIGGDYAALLPPK
ncbi:MAG TPA: TfoX/Sxy family protein [bacterium]|nr:TfoX/Sxy family protein [bacterium]